MDTHTHKKMNPNTTLKIMKVKICEKEWKCKEIWVAILIPGKVGFNTKTITRQKKYVTQ